jgi:thioredoxin 1
MAEVILNDSNFKEEVLNSDIPVLVDFWAEWCGPCRLLSPVVEQLAAERSDILVGKINVDEEMPLAQRFQIRGIPTLVVIKNGKVTGRLVGLQPRSAIEAIL